MQCNGEQSASVPNLLSKVWSSRPYHIFESKNKSSTECIVFPSCFAAKLWRMHKRNTHEGVRRVEARTRAQEVGSSTVCIQLGSLGVKWLHVSWSILFKQIYELHVAFKTNEPPSTTCVDPPRSRTVLGGGKSLLAETKR